MSSAKRFSDLSLKPIEVDEKIVMDSILNMDVKVIDFQELSGKFGDFLWVVVEDLENHTKLGFSTGAKVVVSKLKIAKGNRSLPLIGKIVKNADYYDII